jgi:glycerophosphoryl diester phosphodiesterase
LRGTDPTAHGDLESEILPYLRAGVDGFFTDNADVGFRAREDFLHNH